MRSDARLVLNAEDAPADNGRVTAPDPQFRVPRVLLVEDSPVQARVVAAQLERGWGSSDTTEVACSLTEAISALQRATFNCVLLDLGLPDADGLEAVERVRMTAPGVAIVVLSGQQDETLALMAVREGAQDYLVKGRVDHEHIVRAISYAIERKQQEAVLVRQALYDGLTGLANRAQLLSRIDIALSRNQRHGEYSALIFLDLDGFKPVNDQYGHEIGDRVLVEVARRLTQISTRGTDLVARLGGDEFVMLCEDTTDAQAALIVSRIRSTFTEPIEIGAGPPIIVGVSAGVAVAGSGAAPNDLLRDADSAMYIDKASANVQPGRTTAALEPAPPVLKAATTTLSHEPSARRQVEVTTSEVTCLGRSELMT